MSETPEPIEFRVRLGEKEGSVRGLISLPAQPAAAYIFAHGAGAGMDHVFMESVSELMVAGNVAVLRYQFPYMEAGRRAPNPPRILMSTVEAVIEYATRDLPDVPLFAGGKSMGGRMTSMLAAQKQKVAVQGLVFFGFPLHAAGKPSSKRGDHLQEVQLPMLFIQGTRDRLADIPLLRSVISSLSTEVTLIQVEDGDHSLKVPKRSGRTNEEVLSDVTSQAVEWMMTTLDS